MAAVIAPVGLCGGALGAARTNGIRRGATSARALGFKGGEGMGQSASLATSVALGYLALRTAER